MVTRKPLTERERRFVEAVMGAYAHNHTQAATVAGYAKGSAKVTASRLLRHPHIRAAMESRAKDCPLVASREQLQTFWTETFKNPTLDLRDRLKASQLLGSSLGVFLDKHELTLRFDHEQYLRESLEGGA